MNKIPITAELIRDNLPDVEDLSVLGEGTYGKTFRAVMNGKEIALKVLHLPGMPQYLRDREVRSLQSVDSRHVVGYLDSGSFEHESKQVFYLKFEFIPGGTAGGALEQDRVPSNAGETRGFLAGLLSGAAAIASAGIYHRDIKPDNIALRGGEWTSPVLLDFGLAKVLEMSTHTEYPRQIGTTLFMSPEQLRGEPAKSRSDLFSIGLATYRAGTGRHAFMDATVTDTAALHARMQDVIPQDPRDMAPDRWDDATASTVIRLLSFQPYDRLSAERALKDLEVAS